jgi:hypothetical protein
VFARGKYLSRCNDCTALSFAPEVVASFRGGDPSPAVVFVIAAIIAGLIAAIFPARRAARLDVLRALQYE